MTDGNAQSLDQLISSPENAGLRGTKNSAGGMLSGNLTPLDQFHFDALSSADNFHGNYTYAENPSSEINLYLKHTQTDVICEKSKIKTKLKLKINWIQKYIFFASYLSYETIWRPPQSRKAIPLYQ
jgi:hypothetical protein